MKIKKLGSITGGLLATAILIATLAGCAPNEGGEPSSAGTISSQASEVSSSSSAVSSQTASQPLSTEPLGYQLNPPEKGEEIAVITTSKGVIKMRLFADAAPKAVENFKQLAEKGFYNGVIFHRVIDNFMIQTGIGEGDSIYGASFEDEFNPNLLNLRGSVSMANAGPNTNGTQFFINQAPASKFAGWDYYEEAYKVYQQNPEAFTARYKSFPDMSKITDDVKKLYEENGGNPNLDGNYSTTGLGHTVFGQVFDGMDVVDAISSVKTNSNDKPVEDITIEKVEITTYEG